MRDSYQTANPPLRSAYCALLTLLAFICLFFGPSGATAVLASAAILFAAASITAGLQKEILFEHGFIVIRYTLGSVRYPIQDIFDVRMSQRNTRCANRVDIVTRSKRLITLYPRSPEIVMSRLENEMAERAGAANPCAFGTSGISPAEQARMPEASRDT